MNFINEMKPGHKVLKTYKDAGQTSVRKTCNVLLTKVKHENKV